DGPPALELVRGHRGGLGGGRGGGGGGGAPGGGGGGGLRLCGSGDGFCGRNRDVEALLALRQILFAGEASVELIELAARSLQFSFCDEVVELVEVFCLQLLGFDLELRQWLGLKLNLRLRRADSFHTEERLFLLRRRFFF